MSGNVYEWCSDNMLPYSNTEVYDQIGGKICSMPFIIRGGDWLHHTYEHRSANRFSVRASNHSDVVGFRPCLLVR